MATGHLKRRSARSLRHVPWVSPTFEQVDAAESGRLVVMWLAELHAADPLGAGRAADHCGGHSRAHQSDEDRRSAGSSPLMLAVAARRRGGATRSAAVG